MVLLDKFTFIIKIHKFQYKNILSAPFSIIIKLRGIEFFSRGKTELSVLNDDIYMDYIIICIKSEKTMSD